ncbi:MAG: AAA family ATPase, partial [Actinobacteria bacterium]|nr:AAA family ATPase [Actinomycetota bacterium]
MTFVLADVEGSTRLWEAHPEAMKSVVGRLNAVIDETVDAHSGVRPVEQGEGDSFVAAFSRASDAVSFAVDFQRRIASEPWPDGIDLAVRIALHSGEPHLRDEGNYMGEVLNRCARLRALAHGGQVLVSGATADLVIDHLPDGAFLKDLGLHRLRDLTRAERVGQLCHPDLTATFPPLRSLDRLPNNLPLQLTTFVGRGDEMIGSARLLAANRMVTLTGAGGAGKTRLAVQLAAERLEDHPDGVWLVDLAPVSDAARVAAVVAGAMGVSEVPSEALADTLVRELRDARVLVVLDNCEHLLDACVGLTERLLRSCPGLTILATSREPLGVEGEASYRVPSLGLPADDGDGSCESVELFVDRAALVRPTFTLTHDNASAVVEICRRLDGIPLAIELAAARCRALAPAQIATQLSDRFGLLAGGRRAALPRQRTLEASVDWSYELLTDDERSVLSRLAVFAGGFSLEAAEVVCSGDSIEAWRVVDLLTSLVDKSLVQVEGDGPATRFRLLETIRHYARAKLIAVDGEAAAARDRHLGFFVALGERARVALVGRDMVAWLSRLDDEIDNLRAAHDWADESGRLEASLELGESLWVFWQRRYFGEWLERMRPALTAGVGDQPLRARALLAAAWMSWNVGDFDSAVPAAEEGSRIAAEVDDGPLLGHALDVLGWQALSLLEERADALLEQAVELLRAAGEHWFLADALWGLAAIAIYRGEHSTACGWAIDALAVSRESGNPMLVARSLMFLVIARANLGQFADAERLALEAIDTAALVQDELPLAVTQAWLGWLALARGDIATGLALCDEALALSRPHNLAFGIAMALWTRARGEYRSSSPGAAVPSLEEAEVYLAAMGQAWALACCKAMAAEVALARGETENAGRLVDEGLALVGSSPS